jgi:hypothetical protein
MEKFLTAVLGIALTTVVVVAEAAIVGYVTMWAFHELHHDVNSIPPLGFNAAWAASFALLTLVRTARSSNGASVE